MIITGDPTQGEKERVRDIEAILLNAGVPIISCYLGDIHETFIVVINGRRLEIGAHSNRVDGAWLTIEDITSHAE